MKVLVVGATGRFGHLVIPELRKRGAEIFALRRAGGIKPTAHIGVTEYRTGDLDDLPSLERACEGMDGVFHLNPAFAPHEEQLGINMVRAAERTGARKFVFSSVIHPSISGMVNHSVKRPVEEALYGSKLTYTVLQPAMFMQNMTAAWASILARQVFALPYSVDQKACYVDYRDVAETAAIALTTDRLDNGTFELCSQGMFTRVDVAHLMSLAANLPIRAESAPFQTWADQMRIIPGPVRDGLEKMYDHYDRVGFHGGNSLVLEAILGRKPRTVAAFFEELAADANMVTEVQQ